MFSLFALRDDEASVKGSEHYSLSKNCTFTGMMSRLSTGPAHKNSPKYHLSPEVIAEGCLEALALNAQARRFALEPIERQLADDIEVAR